MAPRIVAGSANPRLAGAAALGLGGELVPTVLDRFPDGEFRPVVGPVRGDDVYVIQPTSPPVNEHLVELLLLLDACRRAGAMRVTAVVPYFGYARQDRRCRPGEAIGASLFAGAIAAAGADRLVVVDPHMAGFESSSPIPVEILTALPMLTVALGDPGPGRWVVVAPDLGAVKLAERLAAPLGLPMAAVRKSRITGSTVDAVDVFGDVEGCKLVIIDDMITTGATIEAAVRVLVTRGAMPHPIVAATHGLLVDLAPDRLDRLELGRLLVTDTVSVPWSAPNVELCSVGSLLTDAIGRLHREQPLDDLAFFG